METSEKSPIDLGKELEDFRKKSDESIAELKKHGFDLPIIDLSQWLTLKRYTEKYNLKSTSVVTNWIARGIVPADCTIVIPELNNIRLIKNQRYSTNAQD